jgi:hypothetical protein
MNAIIALPVRAILVPANRRMNALPNAFGSAMLLAENTIYNFASELGGASYRGGLWDFYDTSTGAFYMVPHSDRTFLVNVRTNGYTGTMSPDAFGITCCLFAYSHLSMAMHERNRPALSEMFGRHYHALRDFIDAREDEELAEVWRAID